MKQKSLDSYITRIIEESVKSTLQRKALQEKEKQDSLSGGGKASGEEEKMKTADISVDDVVEKLNSIRSGKSFKDENIFSALQKYFEDLDEAEKTALLAFLKGIAQIVTGEIQAPEATQPSDTPADVEMKKTSGPKKVSIKPSVIKAPSIEKSEKKPSGEDTSGPVPITPKK